MIYTTDLFGNPDAPTTAAELEQLSHAELVARNADLVSHERLCKWGHGQGRPTEDVGALCSSCTPWDEEDA